MSGLFRTRERQVTKLWLFTLWTEGMSSAKKLREYWTGLCRWPVGILDYMLQVIWRVIWLNHANDLKERRTESCRRNDGILDWILQIRRNIGLNNAGDLIEYRTESRRRCKGILDLMLQIFWRKIWMNPIDEMREYWTELCTPDRILD
jgi:hypothetical protein